jgi:hypothetical protein
MKGLIARQQCYSIVIVNYIIGLHIVIIIFLLSLFLLLFLFLGLEFDQLDTPSPLPSQVIFYRPQGERDCTQGVSPPMWLSHFWGRTAW